MSELEKKLKELLESISDSYEDFVKGIMLYCKTDDVRKKVINYIKNGKNPSSSDVIDYEYSINSQ